jgi:hypothetical protein
MIAYLLSAAHFFLLLEKALGSVGESERRPRGVRHFGAFSGHFPTPMRASGS